MRARGAVALSSLALPLALLLLTACVHRAAATVRCIPTDNTMPSGTRYAVELSGGPKTYVPGQTYRVSVKAKNVGDAANTFKGFVLTVEQEADRDKGPAGRFTLYSDSKSKFDERCANTVTHANFLPTGEVQIDWVAPKEGAGCVIFRAAVMDSTNTWYADELMDASLTQRVCEDQQVNMDEQGPIEQVCNACDEAKYEVTFEGLWSRHTHPKDFPADSWVTRFSDVIGASHDVTYRFWEYNGLASDGLKQVAERGTTRALEAELKAESEHIRTIIKARGISYPNVTGKTFAVFRVDRKNHLMSLVSMIDPSPDWIVGVSGLELCLANGSWVEQVQLNLYPFDVGTDSGLTYIAPDQPTNPQEPIRKLSSSFPNTDQSPFFDPTGEPMKPLAKLSLVRQRLYEKSCEDAAGDLEDPEQPSDANRDESESYVRSEDWRHSRPTVEDLRYASYARPTVYPLSVTTVVPGDVVDCRLSPWSPWTPCEVTCGTGYRIRTRQILVNPQNGGKACDKKLLARKRCTRLPPCSGSLVRDWYDEEGDGEGFQRPGENDCIMSEWSAWSQCTSTCGVNAQKIRSRTVERDPGPGGRPCGLRLEVRNCDFLPCFHPH